ncbi:hypothetical protein MTO96_032049 [Rhipicephalus appendiculatus]
MRTTERRGCAAVSETVHAPAWFACDLSLTLTPVMMLIQRKRLVLLLTAPILCFYVFLRTRYIRTTYVSMPELKGHSCPLLNSGNSSNVTKLMPRILLWTPFITHWYSTLNDTRVADILLANCSSNCTITNDPCLVIYSDAFVFHVNSINIENLLRKRFNWQKWVFSLMESPPHTHLEDFNHTYHMFNCTMTYRRDHDIVDVYDRVTARDRNSTLPKVDLKALWKSKNKTAVWMVSHCVTDGAREVFVAEMRKYVDVDVCGECGHYECPRSRGDACYVDFERTYFYMLAFENSICVDYVTEKLFKPLDHYLVPVVFGGANYSERAPPHSYIDALSFESPESLTEYLRELSDNYTEYASYFKWKESHQIKWEDVCCKLCAKLHNQAEVQRASSYDDIGSWWFGKGGQCRSWDRVERTLLSREDREKLGQLRLTYSHWLQRPSTGDLTNQSTDDTRG